MKAAPLGHRPWGVSLATLTCYYSTLWGSVHSAPAAGDRLLLIPTMAPAPAPSMALQGAPFLDCSLHEPPPPTPFQALMDPSPAPSPAMNCDDPVSNARGEYTTTIRPCLFRFYAHDPSASLKEVDYIHYHTSNLCLPQHQIGGNSLGEDEQLQGELVIKEYIHAWPDECVGDFVRCYSLEHHQTVIAPYLCHQVTWPIPPEATHVSVDCRLDRELVLKQQQEAIDRQEEKQRLEREQAEQQLKEQQQQQTGSGMPSSQPWASNGTIIFASCLLSMAIFSHLFVQPILQYLRTRDNSPELARRRSKPSRSLPLNRLSLDESDDDAGDTGSEGGDIDEPSTGDYDYEEEEDGQDYPEGVIELTSLETSETTADSAATGRSLHSQWLHEQQHQHPPLPRHGSSSLSSVSSSWRRTASSSSSSHAQRTPSEYGESQHEQQHQYTHYHPQYHFQASQQPPDSVPAESQAQEMVQEDFDADIPLLYATPLHFSPAHHRASASSASMRMQQNEAVVVVETENPIHGTVVVVPTGH